MYNPIADWPGGEANLFKALTPWLQLSTALLDRSSHESTFAAIIAGYLHEFHLVEIFRLDIIEVIFSVHFFLGRSGR